MKNGKKSSKLNKNRNYMYISLNRKLLHGKMKKNLILSSSHIVKM